MLILRIILISLFLFKVQATFLLKILRICGFDRLDHVVCPVNFDEENVTFEPSLRASSHLKLDALPFDLLYEMLEYLDLKSLLNLRQCSKSFMNNHTLIINHKFISSFKSNIITGFDGFDINNSNNNLASTHLMPFKKHLTSLFQPKYFEELKSRNVIANTLSSAERAVLDEAVFDLRLTDDFINFLILALYVTHQIKPVLFWKLAEALLKARIFVFQEFDYIPEFGYRRVFEAACELNLKFLCQFTLTTSESEDFSKANGCMRCIKRGNIDLFKRIIEVSRMPAVDVIEMLTCSIKFRKFEFFKLIYIEFSSQIHELPIQAAFTAINVENAEVLRFLLHRNVDLFYGNQKMNGVSPLEHAALRNCSFGIRMITSAQRNNVHLKLYLGSLHLAIQNSSHLATMELIDAIHNNFGSFKRIVSGKVILKLIESTIEARNVDALKLILLNSPEDILNPTDLSEYNPIYHMIETNFDKGFMCFVKCFGDGVLNIKDHKQRTPLLFAASCGNSSMARRIFALNPSQLNAVDIEGNGVLHIALKELDHPMNFINAIFDLDLDWNHLNNDNKSPIGLFRKISDISSEDLRRVFSRCMEAINEDEK